MPPICKNIRHYRFNDADLAMDKEFAHYDPQGHYRIFDRLIISNFNRYELRKDYLRYVKAQNDIQHTTDYSEINRLTLIRYTAQSYIIRWFMHHQTPNYTYRYLDALFGPDNWHINEV